MKVLVDLRSHEFWAMLDGQYLPVCVHGIGFRQPCEACAREVAERVSAERRRRRQRAAVEAAKRRQGRKPRDEESPVLAAEEWYQRERAKRTVMSETPRPVPRHWEANWAVRQYRPDDTLDALWWMRAGDGRRGLHRGDR